MSLINEALKKAQRQRSLDTAPLSTAPSGVAAAAVTTHVRAASHKRSFAPLWFGLGVLALGAGSTALVLRYGVDGGLTSPAVAVGAGPSPVNPVPVHLSPAPLSPTAPTITQTAIAADAPAIVLPPFPERAPVTEPATPPHSTSAPLLAETPKVAPASSVESQDPAPTPSPPPASQVAVKPVAPIAAVAQITNVAPVASPLSGGAEDREAKIQAFLNSARITGVRGGDRDARLLMNERVWRPGESVSPELGLRLQAVRPGRIVFSDAQGKTYEKAY